MDWLKGFDLSLWWNVLIAVGAALVVAALAAHERGLIFIGLGMISWGFGESRNHPKFTTIEEARFMMPAMLVTGHPRITNGFGLTLDACGLILIAYGLYRLLTA